MRDRFVIFVRRIANLSADHEIFARYFARSASR